MKPTLQRIVTDICDLIEDVAAMDGLTLDELDKLSTRARDIIAKIEKLEHPVS